MVEAGKVEGDEQGDLRQRHSLVHAHVGEHVDPDGVLEGAAAVGADTLGPHEGDESGGARAADGFLDADGAVGVAVGRVDSTVGAGDRSGGISLSPLRDA